MPLMMGLVSQLRTGVNTVVTAIKTVGPLTEAELTDLDLLRRESLSTEETVGEVLLLRDQSM